ERQPLLPRARRRRVRHRAVQGELLRCRHRARERRADPRALLHRGRAPDAQDRERLLRAREMSERVKRAAAIAAIVVAALVIFGPAFAKNEVFVFRDHADYFEPMRIYTAQHLRVWRLPLWNPYNGSGEPWLANPQTAVFYPPAWL